MSAAVVASVLRNRKTGQRRVAPTPHIFTWRRFFLILFLGAILFIPGIVVTIIGIKNSENLNNFAGNVSLYKFIGPVGLVCGVLMIMASGIYYCCWGYHSTVSTRHVPKRKPSKDQTEQLEPLKSSAVRTISNEGNAASLLSTNDYGTSKAETRTIRSERRSNSSRPPRHHTSSTSSTDSRNQSHHSSKHRSSSHSNHGNYSNSPITNICPNPPSAIPDNQVSVVPTAAPLALEEAGFVNEHSIDINVI